jgi:hypothetical protein
MTAPRHSHWLAGKRILRYLKGTMDYGIWYSGIDIDLQLAGYSDAYWDGSLNDNKSTIGYMFHLGSSVVSWS